MATRIKRINLSIFTEDSWDVLSRKRICCVGNQQARLSDSAITDNDTPKL